MTDLRDLRFGIEIETMGQTRHTVASIIQGITGGTITNDGGVYSAYSVRQPDGRTWKVVTDGSINAPRDLQAEINSPILTYGDIDTLQRVIRALRAGGVRVDGSCGIHIHVDAALFDGKALGNLMQLTYAHEDVLVKALAVADRRIAQWCKPVEAEVIAKVKASKSTTKEEVGTIWYGDEGEKAYRRHDHYDSSRYHGLNLHSTFYRGTVEFRYFEATLHAGKIKAYIQLVLALAAHALNAKAVRTEKKHFDAAYNHKYEFRCFLLRLGLIGDEFKTARELLLKLLPGNAEHK